MILLDTNALLWVYEDSSRLGAGARELVAHASRVYYSAVSVTELGIKEALGRLDVLDDPVGEFESSGLVMLPLTARHSVGMRSFPQLVRHDPFDRMLLAQAAVDGLTLVTSERTLLGLGLAYVVDATC